MRLEGKVAIVTGGGRGIGHATVALFAQEGAIVYAVDKDAAESFANASIDARKMDVRSLDAWAKLTDEIGARHGRIDVLVNNAGLVGSYAALHEIDLDDWHHVLDVNLTGTFYGMRSVVPWMRRVGNGSIVNVSSIWGIVGAAGVSAYQASKGAVTVLSRNAAISYVADGIRVNSIHPGIVDTPMIRAQSQEVTDAVVGVTPMRRLATPVEVAWGVVFLASDEASYITGAALAIDGGYTAV